MQLGVVQEHRLAFLRTIRHGAALKDRGRALDGHDRAADEAARRALDDGRGLASRLQSVDDSFEGGAAGRHECDVWRSFMLAALG